MDSYQNIVSELYTNEIQVRRIHKEIQQLLPLQTDELQFTLQKSNQGLKILITVESVRFIIFLDLKFPFVFPRVHIQNTFTDPPLSDGRDFIEDIIERPWSPSVLLSEIVRLMPNFVKKLGQMEKSSLFEIGKYQVNQEYDLEDQMEYESLSLFHCSQITDQAKIQQKYLQLNADSIVFFDLVEPQKTTLMLMSQEKLSNLSNLKKQANSKNQLVFYWKQEEQKEEKEQVIVIDKIDQCISCIIKNMKKLNLPIQKNFGKVQGIAESSVSKYQFEQVNIEQIIETLKAKEKQDLTKENAQQIIKLYQQAIEYFSVMDDPTFEKYVKQMREFVQREDVISVLKS